MDPENALHLAEMYVRLRMGERALKYLEEASPDDARTWLWRSNALHVHDRYDEALAAAQHGLDLDGSSEYLHHAMARALFAKGHFAEAEAAIREALRIAPHYAEAHAFLALILDARGRKDAAARASREAMQLAPGNHEMQLLDVFVTLRRDREAADRLSQAVIADAPDSAPAHWMRGLSLATNARYRKAAQHFAIAAQIDPGMRLFVLSARISNHWLLWPLRITAPAGWYAGTLSFMAGLFMIGGPYSQQGWTLLSWSIAWLLYYIAGGLAIIGVPLRKG